MGRGRTRIKRIVTDYFYKFYLRQSVKSAFVCVPFLPLKITNDDTPDDLL
jgi:hypothetical protein